MSNETELQILLNDEAHERLLQHLRLKRAGGFLTRPQYMAAIDATYTAFGKRSTPEQTWNRLVEQAKLHGLDLTVEVQA